MISMNQIKVAEYNTIREHSEHREPRKGEVRWND